MRLEISQHMRQDMRQRMTPRMIQSMEILQLPAMALQERIEQELIENPILELREPTVEDAETTEEPPAEPVEAEPEADGFTEDWDDSYAENHRPSRAALGEEADRKHDAMQNMASRPPSLHDYLAEQLVFHDVDETIEGLAEAIIQNIDDRGYLIKELREIALDFGGPATLPEAEEALRLVQRFDPPGVGARDLRECLLLQVTPETPYREVLEILIDKHLENIRQNRLPLIEKKTGIPIETIKEALGQLRRLDPHPGSRFVPGDTRYVVPDLIVEPNDQGEYVVRLAEEHAPQLSISRHYQKLLKTKEADPATREFIQRKIQSARWLLESIEQRRNTVLKVASAIIEHQKDFLDKGPEAIEPLKMQQIADRVKVHVTTVSRAVDDKWIQTPRGIFPLKRFFVGGTTSADGSEVAWDAIKRKLLEIIAEEDKQAPLSDDDIVKSLARQGLPVARRTVTKYRRILNIPSSHHRREF